MIVNDPAATPNCSTPGPPSAPRPGCAPSRAARSPVSTPTAR
ncbi:hypothetical protein ACFQ60_40160 [Streptomyces zhihengii]